MNLADSLVNFFKHLTNQSRYHYQDILNKYLPALSIPITDLNRFARLTAYLVWRSLKLSGTSFMVLDRERHCYQLIAANGEAEELVGLTLTENTLIHELALRNFVSRQLITDRLANPATLSLEEVQKLKVILSDLDKLKADLIIAVTSIGEYLPKPTVLASLNLGQRSNNFEYSIKDVDFLVKMVKQAVINVEYAFILAELKKNQAQVLRSEKLATLGTTTAGIAHELKGPLTYLTTVSEVLREKVTDQEFLAGVVQMLPTEVERMRLMVEGILDYSRFTNFAVQPMEITEVIKKVLALLAFEIKKNNISVKEDYRHTGQACGDRNRLTQVFINLLSNAIQAIGQEGGSLTIVTVDGQDQLLVSITDTGGGIPKEKIDLIFDPFFTTKESGTGLGLAISKKIIEEHKGSLVVESYLGVGSTFTLSLPTAIGYLANN